VPRSLLSDDEQSYFMEMESLFNHPGWARLTRELEAEIAAVPAEQFERAKSYDDILVARARYDALKTFVAYPQHVEIRRQQIEQAKALDIDDLGDIA